MKRFRLFSMLLAVCCCLSFLSPAAFAEGETPITYQQVAYAQANTLSPGEHIVITGTPNYSAYTANDSTTLLAFDTADGTWFTAIGPVSVDAFRAGLPSNSISLYGVYAGTMDSNGMPILDIQQGAIVYYETSYEPGPYGRYENITRPVAVTTSEITQKGQTILDRAAAEAQEKAAQEAAERAAEQAAEEAQWQKIGKMVWIPTHGGECYHSHASCSNMIDPEKVDLGYAKYMEFRACKKCYGR